MTVDHLVASDDDAEVGMYFGDADLQQSLAAHYVRMLSQVNRIRPIWRTCGSIFFVHARRPSMQTLIFLGPLNDDHDDASRVCSP
jgi:hypothetical protein